MRVDAVTDRSRELDADEGIPVWEGIYVLESMEDARTGNIVFPD